MIPALVIAALAVAALAYVAVPLRARPRSSQDVDAPSILEIELESRKRSALGAIVEIEEERDLGKLAEPDFAALRDEYERQALVALTELDTMRSVEASEDDLEVEIAEMRKRLACPACGALRPIGERCSRCGA